MSMFLLRFGSIVKINEELIKHQSKKTFKQRKENGKYVGRHKKGFDTGKTRNDLSLFKYLE